MDFIFNVGQRVVAIKSHSEGYFKKGDEFTVLANKVICCKPCIKITEGKPAYNALICTCGNRVKSNEIFYMQESFAPIQEIGNMTFEDAIEYISPKKLIKSTEKQL